MRQTLFLLVIAALWLGTCSYPHATTAVDDLTHGVRMPLSRSGTFGVLEMAGR